MNEPFEKIFNVIYEVFVETGLININNEQEKKREAFHMCLPVLLNMQQLSSEKELYSNVEKIVNLLDIKIDNKEHFKNIFDVITLEISKLKMKLNSLELKIFMQEIKMDAYGIVNLFRHYYVEDKIKAEYPTIKNWTDFTGNNC